MAIDSTAELLFKIAANTDDAESNIAKFRTLLNKDLSDVGAEFESWSDKIFGEISSVQALATAGFAALAAGVVLVGSAVSKATERYDEYTEAISRGVRLTGLHAEDMSTLYLLAQKSGVAYDDLVNGLTKFSTTIVKASQGNHQAQQAFKDLGISQKDVIAGQQDMLPLLLKTMDAFHNNTSAVQRDALAREVFSRGGTSMIAMLKKGSDAFEDMKKKAQEWGLELSDKDLAAAMEYKAALRTLKAEQDGLEISIGKATETMRIWWATAKVGVFDTLRDLFTGKGLTVQTGNPVSDFFASIGINAEVAKKKIQEEIEAAKNAEKLPPTPLTGGDPKQTTSEFYGLSTVLESIKGKIAEETSGYAKLNAEISRYATEALKATEELKKLHSEGKISQETYQRESTALAAIPTQMVLVRRQGLQKLDAEDLKHNFDQSQALDQVHTELADKAAVYDAQDFEAQRAKFEKESDQLRQSSEKKAQLTAAEYALLAQIHEAGLNKIARDQQQAFLGEIEKLQQHLEQMVLENLTGINKLDFQYQQDLRAFSEVEEEKTIKAAGGESARATVHAFYQQINKQLLQQHQQDLQKLLNSQGWQGVFGDHFASQIKKNEALSREWANSTNQSLLMVKVSMEELREVSQESFEQFAQGMGQGIAQAIVYSTSIGQAMRAALAATLESVAARCLAESIYALGLGFLRLAEHDAAGAASAFTAAEVLGSAGAVAAITGRMVAPKDSSSASASSSGSSSTTSDSSSSSSTSSSSAQAQPTVIVNVNGHVIGQSGAAELCDIINQAVYGNDATLYATHTRTGVPIG